MKIKSIREVGKHQVYDICVKDAHHYVLENGVITHNSGITYSSDTTWVIGKAKEKEGTETTGYRFIIRVNKSRFVREGSAIPIVVKFDGGIDRYSGLLDIALDLKAVVKPALGWFSRVDPDTGVVEDKKVRAKDTDSSEFWDPILKNKAFREAVKKKFQVSYGSILSTEAVDAELEKA